MPAKRVIVPVLLLLMVSAPALRAGMPSYDLDDVVALRLQDISFFLLLTVGAAFGFKLVWNAAFKEVAKVPQLKFKQSLVLTFVLGLLMLLVLTMISGARELLTPGAWKKQGSTYKLAEPASLEERTARLRQLHQLIQVYAVNHGGKRPLHEFVPDIPPSLWQSGDSAGTRLIYVTWSATNAANPVLVAEPASFGAKRLGLFNDGTVRPLAQEEIDRLFAGPAK